MAEIFQLHTAGDVAARPSISTRPILTLVTGRRYDDCNRTDRIEAATLYDMQAAAFEALACYFATARRYDVQPSNALMQGITVGVEFPDDLADAANDCAFVAERNRAKARWLRLPAEDRLATDPAALQQDIFIEEWAQIAAPGVVEA